MKSYSAPTYNVSFESRRWLFNIRYEKGEEEFNPSISKGVGVSLAGVDLKWKTYSTYITVNLSNCIKEIMNE